MVEESKRMTDFHEGEYIIYHIGERYELGKIKKITEDGAFVLYSKGETAAKTPFDSIHKLVNGFTIKDTTLGGSVPASVALQKELNDCRNELCLKCGCYTDRHLGSCDGCRWYKKPEAQP